MCKVKTISKKKADELFLFRFPCFSSKSSVIGLKKLGNELLVRSGSLIFNVSSEPSIYYNI